MDTVYLDEAAQELFEALYEHLSDFDKRFLPESLDQEEGEALEIMKPYAQKYHPVISDPHKRIIEEVMGYTF